MNLYFTKISFKNYVNKFPSDDMNYSISPKISCDLMLYCVILVNF